MSYHYVLTRSKQYKLLSEKSLQTILTNHYKVNYFKQYLQTIIREIIPNNASKLF